MVFEKRRHLFAQMLRIRRVQERIHDRYLENMMQTPVPLCTGPEAIAVGVCAALRADDVISSNHRGHGHYLAKGGDLRAMIAELHGRATGCSRGYGGSMHLIDTAVGHLGSSSIVGGGIPIGTGHALAFAMRGQDAVSVVFLGDGASEEGVFYESCNFAILHRLPVIFVLENNGIAVCSPLHQREACPKVFHKGVASDQMLTHRGYGNDVEEVYAIASRAVERARAGQGPAFLEFETYRLEGHAGCKSQDAQNYRDIEQWHLWEQRCPVRNYREKLVAQGHLSQVDIDILERAIAEEIDAAFAFALSSPFPGPLQETGIVYCE